jgi:hypothetical protein
MPAIFDRDQLLDALDEIGRAAIDERTRLDIVVFLLEFYPNSLADAEKARFVLKHILSLENTIDAPRYPC